MMNQINDVTLTTAMTWVLITSIMSRPPCLCLLVLDRKVLPPVCGWNAWVTDA